MSDPGPRRDLRPAEHVVPPPAGGWSGADLDDDDLVDDAHIAADPTSYVIRPGEEASGGA